MLVFVLVRNLIIFEDGKAGVFESKSRSFFRHIDRNAICIWEADVCSHYPAEAFHLLGPYLEAYWTVPMMA